MEEWERWKLLEPVDAVFMRVGGQNGVACLLVGKEKDRLPVICPVCGERVGLVKFIRREVEEGRRRYYVRCGGGLHQIGIGD